MRWGLDRLFWPQQYQGMREEQEQEMTFLVKQVKRAESFYHQFATSSWQIVCLLGRLCVRLVTRNQSTYQQQQQQPLRFLLCAPFPFFSFFFETKAWEETTRRRRRTGGEERGEQEQKERKDTERNRKKQKHVDGCDGAGPIARVKRKEGNNGPGR